MTGHGPGAGSWLIDLAARAEQVMPAHVWRYVSAGAREEVTAHEANGAWVAARLWPRVLRDVREVSLGVECLGATLAAPVAIAPTSLQRLVHPDGELAMARAAASCGTLLTLSSNAGTGFEEIGATGVTWWLQAYLTADRALIEPVLRRARAAGAAAVVLTVDTPFPGPKWHLAPDSAFGDLTGAYGVNHCDVVRGTTPGAEHARDLGLRDLVWIREVTDLPVVVKGVLHPADAVRAADAGASAVWVSNHGGRQLDRAVDTATALPLVRQAVGGAAPVLVDGGLRSGLDVLSALTAGADLAFLGRPALYALAVGGEPAVRDLLTTLQEDLRESMALAGCAAPQQAADLQEP